MKRVFILIIIACVMSPGLKAQYDLGMTRTWADQYPTSIAYGHKKLSLDQIQGSPYLDEVYRPGTVITDDGVVYKDIPLRYNCYYDVLEFKKDGNPYDLMPKEKVSRAEFGGQIFKYLTYEPAGSTNKSYFLILAEGKATLCGRYIINFYEEENVQAYSDRKPARFDDLLETFWVSINESPAQRIVNNKKLLEILGDKKNEMQSYISKQKLSVKKAEDLKKIIGYYNTL